MASSTAAAVKAGYWFSTSELQVSKINSSLFTHLYAGFAKVQYPITSGNNISGFTDDVIIFPDKTGNFENFPDTVRSAGRNDTVKALLSIGGEGAEESTAIASVVGNVEMGLRDSFILRSIQLARDHNYDGLDLCWLYRPSTTKEWENLALFLKHWRLAVEKDAAQYTNKLLLTATVFPHPPDVDVDVRLFKAINDNLDWINVLAVDFYTPFNSPKKTGPVHAWFNLDPIEPNRCGSAGIDEWIAKAVPAEKLVLGLPFYGYQWILEDPENNGFFAPAHPAATKDPILYKNIPDIFHCKDYITEYKGDYVATYSYKEATWIGYDDSHSISDKVKKAIGEKKLRGYFAWNLGGDDYDDGKWTLSNAASRAWPTGFM